jgi:endoglucanase
MSELSYSFNSVRSLGRLVMVVTGFRLRTKRTFWRRIVAKRIFAAAWMGVALVVTQICAPAGAAQNVISVRANMLTRDGAPWIPKGVSLVAFVAPDAYLRTEFSKAHRRFGPDELKAIARFGADLVRFQVSQSGCDPQNPIYSSAYVDEIVDAVRLTRSYGFSVIISMDSEPPTGEWIPYGLPTDSTVRAWHTLAPRLSSDQGVMFELYNEPTRQRHAGRAVADDVTWAEWKKTHQPILDQIRKDGAKNVVIVDGLKKGHILTGAPSLSDPEAKVVYAVHPYPTEEERSAADWDRNFGAFAQTHPVLITEWNARSAQKSQCVANLPDIASNLLAYAHAHRIGVTGWSFDIDGTIFDKNGVPTNFENFSCDGDKVSASGQLLQEYFGKHD